MGEVKIGVLKGLEIKNLTRYKTISEHNNISKRLEPIVRYYFVKYPEVSLYAVLTKNYF